MTEVVKRGFPGMKVGTMRRQRGHAGAPRPSRPASPVLPACVLLF